MDFIKLSDSERKVPANCAVLFTDENLQNVKLKDFGREVFSGLDKFHEKNILNSRS